MLAKTYHELRRKQEKELSDFPVAFAFSEEQIKVALKKLNATVEECCTVIGFGDIVRKADRDDFIKMLNRHEDEIRELILSDKQLAYEIFLYEMNNHEYAINWSADEDTLDSLSITFKFLKDHDLLPEYDRARRDHMKYAEEIGMI